MTEQRSSNQNNGRDTRGRFRPGNKVAKGHGSTAKSALWRVAFSKAVSPADVEYVAKRLVKSARAGERWAIELLLDRVLGKPGSFEALELVAKVEELEVMVHDQSTGTCETA